MPLGEIEFQRLVEQAVQRHLKGVLQEKGSEEKASLYEKMTDAEKRVGQKMDIQRTETLER